MTFYRSKRNAITTYSCAAFEMCDLADMEQTNPKTYNEKCCFKILLYGVKENADHYLLYKSTEIPYFMNPEDKCDYYRQVRLKK
jgi:hypothetical protein